MRHSDTGGRNTEFSFAANGGVGVYYWMNGPTGYAVAGGVDREVLLKAAKIVYHQLGY
jgi:anti-sigma factor RsiW